jgi:hypothetical protein
MHTSDTFLHDTTGAGRPQFSNYQTISSYLLPIVGSVLFLFLVVLRIRVRPFTFLRKSTINHFYLRECDKIKRFKNSYKVNFLVQIKCLQLLYIIVIIDVSLVLCKYIPRLGAKRNS